MKNNNKYKGKTAKFEPKNVEVRDKLIKLSVKARKLRTASEKGWTDHLGRSFDGWFINDILIDVFYTNAENSTFHSFNGWIDEGYKVKKGSKGFPIWGKKRSATAKEAEPETVPTPKTEPKDTTTETEKKYKFWPIAYIFSNAQVEPIKTPEYETKNK